MRSAIPGPFDRRRIELEATVIDQSGMNGGATAVAERNPVVETAQGNVRGHLGDGIARFKGIPYAQPTGGTARFLSPRPMQPWSGVRDALAFGRSTPQPGRVRDVAWWRWITDAQPQGEDCLVLNVYTPEASPRAKRPVMFYLHGGGFNTGSASTDGTDGSQLARDGDVVVVTINHRLNVFGFLYLADLAGERFVGHGNAGMRDAVAALRWTRDNIVAFGGDPDNVTIFGQSGGGSKVAVLMAMPQAKGLFHKAIIQSASSLIKMATPEQATHAARGLLDELGGPSAIERLQDVPVAELLGARERAIARANGIDDFRPVMDGVSLPVHPFDPVAPEISKDIPLLIGATDTEQTFFLGPDPKTFTVDRSEAESRIARFVGLPPDDAGRLYDAYAAARVDPSPSDVMIAVLSDQMYRRNDTLAADRKAQQGGAPVYQYLVIWRSPVMEGRLKSPHTMCIPFVFGTYDAAAPMIGDGEDRAALSRKMMDAWVSFARTGVPAAAGLPEWQRYDPDSRATMIFDNACRVECDPRKADRLAFENYPLYSPDAAAQRSA